MDPLLPSVGYCGRSECRKDKRSSSTVLYTASPGGKGGTCMSQGASRETEPVGRTHMHANTHTHSQSSLFMVVMFHKVYKHWISKYRVMVPRGNTVWFLWASGHIPINWSKYNLVLSVFLFKDTLLNIHSWFINVELTACSSVTDAWRKSVSSRGSITAVWH